jgi:hypothetical protein
LVPEVVGLDGRVVSARIRHGQFAQLGRRTVNTEPLPGSLIVLAWGFMMLRLTDYWKLAASRAEETTQPRKTSSHSFFTRINLDCAANATLPGNFVPVASPVIKHIRSSLVAWQIAGRVAQRPD